MVSLPQFWPSLVFILVGGAILAAAVWGGFHSQGFFRGQPAAGKLATIGTLALGSLVVTIVAAGLLITLLPRSSYPTSDYQMTRDGTIYKVTPENGKPSEIVDLEGRPLVDPRTGRKTELADFNRQVCNLTQSNPDFGNRSRRQRWFNQKPHLLAGDPGHTLVLLEPVRTAGGLRQNDPAVHRQSGAGRFCPKFDRSRGPF